MAVRFKRFTFSLLSPLIGIHVGRNPVSGQRFAHIAPFPFFGIDFELKPYSLNEEMPGEAERLRIISLYRSFLRDPRFRINK